MNALVLPALWPANWLANPPARNLILPTRSNCYQRHTTAAWYHRFRYTCIEILVLLLPVYVVFRIFHIVPSAYAPTQQPASLRCPRAQSNPRRAHAPPLKVIPGQGIEVQGPRNTHCYYVRGLPCNFWGMIARFAISDSAPPTSGISG